MQLQREDLIAQTEQYGTMQLRHEDLIAGTEQCEDLHWTQEWAPLSCVGNSAPDLFARAAMMQYTQHNNEDDKDDDAGNHGNNDDQVDDAGDQFVNITTMWWPQTRTPEYDRGAIAP